ncbi:MAG: hypothetical protein HZB50_09100 [Chloroflexi bacterium]|nr:hypothetical protein [Chloroflexota bacterium]
MSMEDILRTLVDSRQQGDSSQSTDQMTNLIGGLLGGQSQGGVNLSDGVDLGDVTGLIGGLMGASQQPQGAGQQPAGGLSGMMGMLESVMGGQGTGANDPMMGLLKPYIAPLAKKANISPEIAMIVVSFVAHKLLSHHPTSGRDSNSFNLDTLLQQIGSGKIDPALLRNSGMVKELSKKTGLDEATAAKSLGFAFSLVGKGATSLMNKPAAVKPASAPKANKS